MDRTHDELGRVFALWAVRTHAPGISWGLIRDGELVTGGGIGTLRVGQETQPDLDSVFRIASMTKSFTGAALMTLVVEDRLRLDDPVATHVPELASWRGPTTDGPPLTVRHLVSMESGLPTDDPWADRHMDITPADLDALMASEPSFAWTPGLRFEYSNLGWGLVGRIIERVAGVPAQELIITRLLEPLGMDATTWIRPEHGEVAEPYRWQDGAWRPEGEPMGDGQIAPMGGLWSTVRDLARWVAFFQDAWPPRAGPDDGPLPRWARREMQQARRIDRVDVSWPRPDGPSRTIAHGYGVGLGVRHDPRLGVVVTHSGGLPGYGSHMRWLPDRSIGVVALANVSYGEMQAACSEAFEVLTDADALGPRESVEPAPALRDAAEGAVHLLSSWDDAAATVLLADNVLLDETRERRAAQGGELVARYGPLGVESLEAETPLRGTITAAGGLVKVGIGINHAGAVQWLDVTDRSRPSEVPIITDPAAAAAAAGTAYVLLRPVADLADAFERWQGQVLDRLGGARATVPAAHATLKAFGSIAAPVTPDDEPRIAGVVAAWAATATPIELRAESLDVFEGEEQLPVVRLAPIPALPDLWARAHEAGLPAGYSDHIGAAGWIAHLTLAYPDAVDAARWAEMIAWARGVDTEGAESLVMEAELIVFDGGSERRLGRFLLGG